MKKMKFDLKKQILAGYILLILIFLINTLVGTYQRNRYEKVVQQSTEVIYPSILKLMELNSLVNNSKSLTSSWVNTELEDDKDKIELKQLHKVNYPKLKKELTVLTKKWKNLKAKEGIEKIILSLEKDVFISQNTIMNSLSSFDSYMDIMVKMEIDEVKDEMDLKSSILIKSIEDLTNIMRKENEHNQVILNNALYATKITNLILVVFIIIAGLSLGVFIANRLTKPIIKVKDVIDLMAKGILPDVDFKERKDEIGEITNSVQSLIKNIGRTTVFAGDIGSGQLDAEFEKLSDDDVLGSSLLDMRNKLKIAKEEEDKRNWATVGLAKFGEILRKDNDNIEALANNIIINLVKYLNINQGGIFVISDDVKNPQMELTAMYAYDRKKYINKEYGLGEGLIGQSWQEGERIFLTDVPQNYTTITSGLGGATPSCILIVPLKVNDQIYGIIEFASFNVFETHEIDFVEKLTESIASTLSSVKVNLRTSSLLEESQQMSEEMKAQEEELRQNAEEMQAIQEDMEMANSVLVKENKELITKIKELEA